MMIENIAAQSAARLGAGKELSIGRMLVDAGKLSADDASRVLALQEEKGLRFGEAAQQLGLVSEHDIRAVLASQFDYQYVEADESKLDPALVAAVNPFGEEAEMLRALRGQLSARWFNGEHKSLAVVAIDSKASAAVVSANLAIVFAQQGQRTLLVDANMRAPRQHELFNVRSKSGLSDALAGRTHDWGVAQVAPFDNLSLLGAGPQPPNPHELLGRPSFDALYGEFVSNFDIVLYDAPPFDASADAYAIARRTRGVLLVIGKNSARQADLREAQAQLLRSGVEIVGSVLVDF